MKHVIPATNWHMTLSDTIGIANDGDVIECHSEAMVELGKRALARMCPDKAIEFVINAPVEPFGVPQ